MKRFALVKITTNILIYTYLYWEHKRISDLLKLKDNILYMVIIRGRPCTFHLPPRLGQRLICWS